MAEDKLQKVLDEIDRVYGEDYQSPEINEVKRIIKEEQDA